MVRAKKLRNQQKTSKELIENLEGYHNVRKKLFKKEHDRGTLEYSMEHREVEDKDLLRENLYSQYGGTIPKFSELSNVLEKNAAKIGENLKQLMKKSHCKYQPGTRRLDVRRSLSALKP